MLNYVKKAIEKYQAGGSVEHEKFVLCVWNGIRKYANDKHVVERGTKALVELSADKPDALIPVSCVQERARTHGFAYGGLWPWLDDNADVVEREPGSGIRIRCKFRKAMRKLILPSVPGTEPP